MTTIFLSPTPPCLSNLPKSNLVSPSFDKNASPEITIIVTTYNDGVWLETCLNSIWQQNFDSWECIIVDDVSSDNSVDVALKYAEEDSRFKVVLHYCNLGLASARNTGIAYAKGKYITMLDGDDFLFQDSLLTRYRSIENSEHDYIVGSYCGAVLVPENSGLNFKSKKEYELKVIDYYSGRGDNQTIASAPMVYTKIVKSLGGFNPSFKTAEDYEFWTRLFRNGFKLISSGTFGVAYRQKRHSLLSINALTNVRNTMSIWYYISRPLHKEELCSYTKNPIVEPIIGFPDPIIKVKIAVRHLLYAYISNDQYQIEEVLKLISLFSTNK